MKLIYFQVFSVTTSFKEKLRPSKPCYKCSRFQKRRFKIINKLTRRKLAFVKFLTLEG